MQHALIKNGKVENIIIADGAFLSTLEGYEAIIEVTDARIRIGTNYDGQDFVFQEPEPAPAPETRMSRLDFQLRFTFDELVAIETAAATTPAVRVLQKQQEVAEFIDLADPNTQLGVMYLVSVGLLTHERGTEILTP